MKVIRKYILEAVQTQTISIATDSTILHLGVEYGVICFWTLEDQGADDYEQKTFAMYQTGSLIDPDSNYLGTVALGDTIWHVFYLL
jgi:hypothetical protein